MKIIYSPKCLEYNPILNPESPERVKNCADFLKEKKFDFLESEPAIVKDVLNVHTNRLVENVKNELTVDPETPSVKDIFSYSLLSAGGAIKACEVSFESQEKTFSLMRPPGHHAGKNFNGGFCYFNNMAIAIKQV